MINRKLFFAGYKSKFGNLNQRQVNGLEFLLTEFDKSILFDTKAKISYALATIKRETADTFQPVKEGYWITNNRVQKLYSYYYNHNRHALDTIFPNGLAGFIRGTVDTDITAVFGRSPNGTLWYGWFSDIGVWTTSTTAP